MHLLIPPPIVGVIIAAVMWVVASTFPAIGFNFSGQHLLSLILIGIGLLIDGIAVIAFFRQRTTITPLNPDKTSKLVESGLYKFSRNPMYLGFVIVLIGWTIRLGNPLNIILIWAFIVYMNKFQIQPEEEILHKKFGNSYTEYCKRVKRWI